MRSLRSHAALPAGCFVVLLVIMNFSPLIYFAEYLINRDYIEQELCVERSQPASCCKGKCYLTRQLEHASTGSPQNSPESVTLKLAELKLLSLMQSVCEASLNSRATIYFTRNVLPSLSTIYSSLFRPPQFA